ncbi:hypothetical protein HYE59_09200 [Aggregatibacter actinomycetemcomitans]|uniref:hypothetical protein n=1 Tax=Aggregatibacter actinomycetemcomitans TaxID=714 RepID=UPI00197B473B|nr:hypothetical protein [Aggregatibacter actinomycetemcomitans]MBN6077702.1 hypothetical protein [Aggregatibacter actinomycetemcomitans]
MNKILFAILSLLSLSSHAEKSEFAKNREDLISTIGECKRLSYIENYNFSQRNIEDFKFFLQKTIDVMIGENLYSVLEKLDYHFEGGENAPKKPFAPIVSSKIIYTYILRESEYDDPCMFEYYASYFYKKSHNYWDFIAVGVLGDEKGVTTHFSDKDFESLNLILEDNFILETINTENQKLYSSTTYLARQLKDPEVVEEIKEKCYAVYVFNKIEKDIPLRFTFCVNKSNYNEHAKYPNKFGRLVIERLD